jgi:hypothetical protein
VLKPNAIDKITKFQLGNEHLITLITYICEFVTQNFKERFGKHFHLLLSSDADIKRNNNLRVVREWPYSH